MSFWPYPSHRLQNPLAIPPGLLRNQISVQSQQSGQDAEGGEQLTWTSILTCMATIITLQQSEKFQSDRFSSQVTHRVSIYFPGMSIVIAGGMQVLFGTRTFVIQTVENVQERNRVLHLMCLEINGGQ